MKIYAGIEKYNRPECPKCIGYHVKPKVFAGTRILHYAEKKYIIDMFCERGHKWSVKEYYDPKMRRIG